MSDTKKPRPKVIAKYTVKAIDYTFDAGNGTKPPQSIVRLQIVKGPQQGATRMWYGSYHESWQESTCAALRALGMTNDDPVNPEGLGSRIAVATERENNFPGAKYKTRIDFIDPIEPAKLKSANPVSTKDAAQVASRFKALFKAKPVLEMHDSVKAPEVVEAISEPAPVQPTAASPFE